MNAFRAVAKTVMTLVALVSPMLTYSQGSTVAKAPDFAYPRQVITHSETTLSEAMKRHDSPAVLRSLIDLTLAQKAIDNDSLDSCIERIVKVSESESDPSLQSMLRLLLAELYQGVYEASPYIFNQRTQPLEPLPADYRLWSGDQLRHRVMQLCREALADSAMLLATPISKYSVDISLPDVDRVYFPTLYDFAVARSIQLLSSMNQRQIYLPLSRLSLPVVGEALPGYNRTIGEYIQCLYDERMLAHAEAAASHRNVGAYLWALLQRQQYVVNHTASYPGDTVVMRRLEVLDEVYNEWRWSEYSIDVLLVMCDVAQMIDGVHERQQMTVRLYKALQEAKKAHPGYSRMGCVDGVLSRYSQRNVNLSHPSLFVPGESRQVSVQMENVKKLSLKLYRLSAASMTDSYYVIDAPKSKGDHTLVSTIELTAKGEVPFVSDTVMSLSFDSPGYYVLVPDFEGAENKRRRSYPVINVSSLALGTTSFSSAWAFVVDPFNGVPQSDVSVVYSKNGRSAETKLLGSTDVKGFLELPSNLNGTLQPTRKGDTSALAVYFYSDNYPRESNITRVKGYTDRAIYHPGDSVGWVGICYTADSRKTLVVEGEQVQVTLNDVNDEPVDTVIGTTDAYGRVAGSMLLPTDRLTGLYTLAFSSGDGSRWLGSISLMVSDYKMPTYYVEIDDLKRDTPAGGVTIGGQVTTYAGMAVAGSRVLAAVSASGRWRWFATPQIDIFTDTLNTDAKGRFELAISKETFETSPYLDGNYFAIFTATSPTGETQTATYSFRRGLPYSIDVMMGNMPDIEARKNYELPVKVTDANRNAVEVKLHYAFIGADSKSVAEGEVNSASPVIDLTLVPSGIYNLHLSLADSQAEAVDIEGVAIYRTDDKLPPRDTTFWLPATGATARGGKASLLYGTTAPLIRLLCTVTTTDSLLSQRWIECSPGMHHLEVDVPDCARTVDVSLMATYRYDTMQRTINIVNDDNRNGIKIEASAFRDHLTPTTDEVWTFRVVNVDGSAANAAVIVDMYNQALDALASQSWSFKPQRIGGRYLQLHTPQMGYTKYTSICGPVLNTRCADISNPAFNTYGRSFANYGKMRNSMLYRSMGTAMLGSEAVEEDMVYDALPMMSKAMAVEASYDEGMVMNDAEEEVATAAAEMKDTLAGGVDGGVATTTQPVDYRDSEVPLALFRPMLSTDSEGNLTLEFMVPNANATWSFNILAYTHDVEVATYMQRVVASKPVMVTPNLPRFMRSGDELTIDASVANATDSTLSVVTVVEIFDVATGQVIDALTSSDVIEGRNSKVVSYTLKAPFDVPMVGYRVRSSSGIFSDGEQSYIEVLPATTPVVESTRFYLAPDESSLSLVLPTMKSDGKVTMEFTANPIWYAVTQLPAIATSDILTTPTLTRQLFSLGVASGLLHQYPQISEALKMWRDSGDRDSVLVSMLNRNDDLKQVLLQATPWVMDAANDEMRMQRLLLLLDVKQLKSDIKDALSSLTSLQKGDGGMAWMKQSVYSSEWATRQMLISLGRLRQLGWLDELTAQGKIDSMTDKALGYICSEAEKEYRRNPTCVQTDMALMATLWPDYGYSTTTRHIVQLAVKDIQKNWRKYGLRQKIDAMSILHSQGFNGEAAKILASIQEYAVQTATMGMWWPSTEHEGVMAQLELASQALVAIHTIAPASSDIDLIRQWMVMQKESTDWGNSDVTAKIVGSMLSVSDKWLDNAGDVKMILDGKEVAIDAMDRYVGEIKTNVDASIASDALLRIDRSGNMPAWGAVVCRYQADLNHVEAMTCDGLSIDKELLVERNGEWQYVGSEALTVGSRVRTRLIVRADRNIDYVVIRDERASILEPVEQLPAPIFEQGLVFYRENGDTESRLFIDRLPRGTYILTYDSWVNNAGNVISGIASAQSQYAPQISAHSGANRLESVPLK